jgi:hypothetical protein
MKSEKKKFKVKEYTKDYMKKGRIFQRNINNMDNQATVTARPFTRCNAKFHSKHLSLRKTKKKGKY